MKRVISFLETNPLVFLATSDESTARVRPFEFQFFENSRFYFCTANTKKVYRQLQTNPYVEICAIPQGTKTVRVQGKAIFSPDELELKKRILEHRPLIRSVYKTAENPVFEIFYIEHGEALIFEIGKPQHLIRF